VPADSLCAVFQDGAYTITQGVFHGGDDDVPDLPEAGMGRHYLGIMHWSRHPFAAEACGAREGVTDGIAIGFRNGSDGLVQFAFGRTRMHFTQRDVAMLRMLAPLFARLVRERPTPSLPAALTVQERRVLSHVAAGASNTEIAQALFIAPSTVRKHLEHAYRKLGVTGRVAAVARLQGRDQPDLDLRERLARLG
jgi:DNA-binding CsgD family transcriptional regulator